MEVADSEMMVSKHNDRFMNSQNINCGTKQIGDSSEGSNLCNFLPGFNANQFSAVTNEGYDSNDTVQKPTLMAFKLQNNSQVINNLQGSVTKVFTNFRKQLSNTKSKLTTSIEDSIKCSSIVGNEKTEDAFCFDEPMWSGIPEDIFKLEIMKSGVILNILDLSRKNYHIVGRSLSCDISSSHETVSQFHAVLLYRKIHDAEYERGIYVYDLNSEYGTFVNGNRIQPTTYILLRSGYMIAFGESQKKYILQTSKDNEEKEADLSPSELLDLKRMESLEEEKWKEEQMIKEKEGMLKYSEKSKGINWGIVDDIDETSRQSDYSENMESDSEELFFCDPKKALYDWFKWEGHDLEYQAKDIGSGQHQCWIDLILDAAGTTERIEVEVSGDKMKAIDTCALKACRVLNSLGFLKRAQEEQQSISRNWEDVDFYESDEDNFLDRTGTVEQKRHQRMKIAGKVYLQTDNEEMLEKHSKIVERIRNTEKLIALQKVEHDDVKNPDEDELDAFMSKLNPSKLNKMETRDMIMELRNLYQEEIKISNLLKMKGDINVDR